MRKLKYFLPGEEESKAQTKWAVFQNLSELERIVRDEPRVKALGNSVILLKDIDGDFVSITSTGASLPITIPVLEIRLMPGVTMTAYFTLLSREVNFYILLQAWLP